MTEEEKRLQASRENRRDLEAELKEERDRYDAQNQEAYDKEVSGENFLKDRAKEDEEEIDGGKLAQSIAFEASVGLATDLATVKLGFAPPVYALANFVSGAVANAIAQKIRGESRLSIGEILASGGVGIIPGTTIKTGKQLSKVVGKAGTVKRAAIATGLAGVGSEAVRIGIDEQRLLSAKEALVGGTLGGITGASLQKILNASPALLKRFNNLIPEPETPVPLGAQRPALAQRIDATDLPDADNTAAMTRYYQQEAEINKALSLEQTKSRNLNLYGADPDIFEEVKSLRDAMNMSAVRGGRFVKVGKDYFTVFTRGGRQQVLPYNKWYSRNVNPFMVPKQLLKKLKKFEAGQQGDLLKVSEKNPAGGPTIKVPYGTQGKFREVVAPTKYPKGTVDEFNNWYKDIFKLQKEEQALNRQISEMLEKLGNIEARNPGKKVFDTDLSHIAPRSKGGSGLTFQEAWILNQQRGADDILDENVLAAAGIPKNWEELFYFWLAQKKPGRELQTAIGNLAQINVDDYFALSKGEALNIVGKRRKDIRNMVNRQIGNKETYRLPGKRGTIQDDFEAAVRASKAGQVGGDIFLNDKLLDIRWVAKNFDDLLEIGDI